MRAVQYGSFGGPEVLQVVEVETPKPKQNEVLVRICAAGVNFFEILMRANRYAVTPPLPFFPGVEVAGIVEALGEGSDPSLLGMRVAVPLFAIGRGGGYAEYIAVDAAALVTLPEPLRFEDAAALMIQGLTALHLIRQRPPAGRSVLIHAGAGGVGSLLIQLARRAGASKIIATASSVEKRALAVSLGAHAAIDYSASGWQAEVKSQTASGADIIYDMVGGSLTRQSINALAPEGEIVFGGMGRFNVERADIELMLGQNQALKGFSLLPLLTATNLQEDLHELFDLAVSGELKVMHGGSFPLEEASGAHRAMESRSTIGKLVLTPASA